LRGVLLSPSSSIKALRLKLSTPWVSMLEAREAGRSIRWGRGLLFAPCGRDESFRQTISPRAA
jgi:hypothetical protein